MHSQPIFICNLHKQTNMFSFFKKQSPLDKLEKKYKTLLEEAFILSKTNRIASDAKQVEAADVLKQIEKLKKD